MSESGIHAEHTLALEIKCASASAAYDILNRLSAILKLQQDPTDDDFPEETAIVPVGTAIELFTVNNAGTRTTAGSATVVPT